MQQLPAVSVLVPSYNHGAYLSQTLASIQNQTVQDVEILVLDDGSTDNSADIIAAHAKSDARITWWQRKNCGLIATLNTLAQAARGEFVAQIDSDDMWTPERLAWGLQDMAEDASLAASFTTYLRIDGINHPVPRADQLTLGALDHEALLGRLVVKNSVCACTAFMRRSALAKIGPFARNFSLSHDWDRWLRLSLVGRLKMRDTIGAFYRQHATNQSLNEAETRRQELAIHDDLAETMIAHHALDVVQQVAIYGRAAALAYETSQPQRLAHHLRKKAELCPLFEHEQVWLLHVALENRLHRRQQPLDFAAQAGLFSHENQQRLHKILAHQGLA